jgi:hypothetical protein
MSEAKLQSDCFLWAWNEKPETRGLLCYNLGNSRNRIDGATNKAMGLIAGRSDMTFYWNRTAYMIEFKLPGEKQSRTQVDWQRLVESNGFTYHIVRSKDEFIELIRFITGRDCSDDTAES